MSDLPNPNITVRGDMTVGRNVTVGGNQIVRGNMTVEHGLNVKGWVSIENLNFPAVGIFDSDDALIAAVTPKPGYIAGVITASQGLDYTVELYKVSDGAWTATGITLPVRVTISATTNIEGIDAQEFAEWQQQVNETLDEKADAEYLTVTPGTGVTTIQLKNGVSATVLTSHQSITGKADKVSGSGHNNKLASLESNGNLADSGKDVSLLDVLGIQVGYFKGIIDTENVENDNVDNIDPAKYVKYIYYNKGTSPHCFVCYDQTTQKYYKRWNKTGQDAYMLEGKVRPNKLYVAEDGTAYYCTGDFKIDVVEAGASGKADKVVPAAANNFASLDATGNLVDSGHKHSDYLTSHQDISTKADKSELTVASANGSTTINLKGSGVGATKAIVYTPEKVNELLGRAVGEAVRCTYKFENAGDYDLCVCDDLLLAAIDGVGILPEEGKVTLHEAAAGEITVAFVFKVPSEIPKDAFKDITTLKDVHLPSFVRSIEAYAFSGCDLLTTGNIDCEAMTPPTLDGTSFGGADMSQATLTVHGVVKTLYDDGNTKWGDVGTVGTY